MLLFICEHQQCMSQSSTWKWIVWDFYAHPNTHCLQLYFDPIPQAFPQKVVMSSSSATLHLLRIEKLSLEFTSPFHLNPHTSIKKLLKFLEISIAYKAYCKIESLIESRHKFMLKLQSKFWVKFTGSNIGVCVVNWSVIGGGVDLSSKQRKILISKLCVSWAMPAQINDILKFSKKRIWTREDHMDRSILNSGRFIFSKSHPFRDSRPHFCSSFGSSGLTSVGVWGRGCFSMSFAGGPITIGGGTAVGLSTVSWKILKINNGFYFCFFLFPTTFTLFSSYRWKFFLANLMLTAYGGGCGIRA